MKKNKITSLFEDHREVKMTDLEKKETWDGVLRRATDFPDGLSPFATKESTWDGVLRRKSDFPVKPSGSDETV